VGHQLRKLGECWRVIHSVPIGKNDVDIDHVVIGPPGIFVLQEEPSRWSSSRAFTCDLCQRRTPAISRQVSCRRKTSDETSTIRLRDGRTGQSRHCHHGE
jgi:hypothetical protein